MLPMRNLLELWSLTLVPQPWEGERLQVPGCNRGGRDDDDDTQRSPSNSRWRPGRRECRGHNPTKKSVTTEVACSAGKLHVHTVDDSVQYIEHKRKTRRDEINTGCCCYKITEFKSRNPRILFNAAEAMKPEETPGARTSREQPKERDK